MFSQRLKELRKKEGLTQAQLANKLNIGTSTIGMYESNIRKPSYNVLKKIASFFNVSVDYLINDLNDEPELGDTVNLEYYIEHIKQLSPSERKQVEDVIDFLLSKYHK